MSPFPFRVISLTLVLALGWAQTTLGQTIVPKQADPFHVGQPHLLLVKAETGGAETLYGEALVLHRQGKPGAALAKLKEAIALAPKNQ